MVTETFIIIYFYSGEQVDGWRGPAQLYLAVSNEGWSKLLVFVWTAAVLQKTTAEVQKSSRSRMAPPSYLGTCCTVSCGMYPLYTISPFLLTTGGPGAQEGWDSWQRIKKLLRKGKRDTRSLQKAVLRRGMQCVEASTACHRFVHRQPCLQQMCLANRQSWAHQWEQIGWLWGKIHSAVAAPLWK